MKLLLTGATGFLGSHLARALLRAGHELILLKRSFSDPWRIPDVLSEAAAYDLDRAGLEEPFRRHGPIDAVVHTATCYGRRGERPGELLAANTLFPLRLLEIAGRSGTDTFVNTDTFFNKGPVVSEYLEEYVLSKRQFLEWGRRRVDRFPIRFINVRIEHMYGEADDEAKFVAQVIRSCLGNEPELQLTGGEQTRDFIHVADVVAAFCRLLEQPPGAAGEYAGYELGTGKGTSLRQFVDTVHRLTGTRTVLRYGALPYRQGEIMHSVAAIGALQALGWEPRYGIEAGLRQTIAWYQQRQAARNATGRR